ncbi:L-asparaginase II protein [Diaporthe eres]|nr:L-asparaginase II protein [Diaporthe eres]
MTLNCTEPKSQKLAMPTEVNVPVHVNNEDVVITDRGGIIENKHRIHAAIVDPKGKLHYAVGNPDRVTLARSAAKPVQALAILETGAADRFHFDDADIALMCASHSSEPQHISRAQQMLKQTGREAEDLACGGHPALSAAINRAWAEKCYVPTGICNNCSGKHAGMIAGAICLDGTVPGYHEASHPMQLRVKQAVEEMSGLCKDRVQWATDGCNLPAPAMPLCNLALMYARLAEACNGQVEESDLQGTSLSGTVSARRKHHLARIHQSMSTYPDMVGGSGRFCTALMKTYTGSLVGNLGADGCYGIAVRAPPDSSSQCGLKRHAIGIAVKVEDGNIDVLYSAVMEILEQLNIGTKDMRQQLAGFHHPNIVNTAGVVTGSFKHQFEVRSL